VRPLNESTVVITGATSGLGRYLAGELASTGARVVVHGRSAERLAQIHADLGTDTALADLASLTEVDRLADELDLAVKSPPAPDPATAASALGRSTVSTRSAGGRVEARPDQATNG